MTTVTPFPLDRFFSHTPVHTYSKKYILLKPESPLAEVFYLEKGYVRMYGVSPYGFELTIHIFTPGAFFPLMYTLNDVSNRYFYEALTPITIRTARKEAVQQFLETNPKVLLDLTKRLLSGLDKVTSRLELLASEKAHVRVASSILYLAKHFGSATGSDIVIDQSFTQENIGSLAGISRETASREWKKLETAGIVSYRKKKIIIHDMTKLSSRLASRS